jgi:ParB family transcriptional regulator, chromosome partitioning protein
MAFTDHGLGKSLSDVFARTPKKDAAGKGYLEVDINTLSVSDANPRQVFDPKSIDELAESIRLHGILQPIVVNRKDGALEIVSGERRYRAAKKIGLAKVPVVIRDDDQPRHLDELRLIENIQREDLNVVELAKAFQTLIERYELTHEEIALRVSKDRSTITNSLRLLTLPEVLLQEIASGTLTMGHAKALLGIADHGRQLALARRAIEEHLSVRQLEELVRAPVAQVTPVAAGSVTAPIGRGNTNELETNLFHLLGTKVSIKEKRGKGSITLHFAGKEHFQRLVAVLERLVKQSNEGSGQ